MASQGIFRYPGLSSAASGVLSMSWTNVLGIQPSVIRVNVPPRTGVPPIGDASLGYENQFWTLKNCLVDRIDVSNNPDGTTTWGVFLLDRRWAWRYGSITGEYNVKTQGTKVLPKRERTPFQLAQLCFEAMGEADYDCSILSLVENDRPYVDWEIENPAQALMSLLDLYACTVSLGKDDNARVVKLGVGLPLPSRNRSSWSMGFDPVNIPSELTMVSAPVEWQIDLELEPVGYHITNDEFVPIDELNYMPEGGWEEQYPGLFEDVPNTLKERDYAQKYIWKRYRVRFPGQPEDPEGEIPPSVLPDQMVPILELEQILPIMDKMVETELKEGASKPKDAIVWGKFFDGRELGATNIESLAGPEGYAEKLIFKGSISIDTENGFVDFSEPITDRLDDGTVVRPKLFLRTAINLYDRDTRANQRYLYTYSVDPTRPTEPEFVVQNDVTLQYWGKVGLPGEWEWNKVDVETQLQYYGNQKISQYYSHPAMSAEYMGFVFDRNCDGAIRQITFAISGAGLATTSMQRNQENIRKAVTYREARGKQETSKLIADRKKSERIQKRTERAKRLGRSVL